jgi:hypothetical protein
MTTKIPSKLEPPISKAINFYEVTVVSYPRKPTGELSTYTYNLTGSNFREIRALALEVHRKTSRGADKGATVKKIEEKVFRYWLMPENPEVQNDLDNISPNNQYLDRPSRSSGPGPTDTDTPKPTSVTAPRADKPKRSFLSVIGEFIAVWLVASIITVVLDVFFKFELYWGPYARPLVVLALIVGYYLISISRGK